MLDQLNELKILRLLKIPKAQNRDPTKSSSVLQLLKCKKVCSITSKGRNIYYMDRYQRKTISKLKNLARF
jgi:hypothetical protein